MENHLSSEKVVSAIRAEWQRKQVDSLEGTALFVKPQKRFAKLQNNKEEERLCDYHNSGTYSNGQCAAQGDKPPSLFYKNRKNLSNGQDTLQPSANTAQTLSHQPTAAVSLDNTYSSNGSAFHTSVNPYVGKIEFVIDSRASHHIVDSTNLLDDLQPIAPALQIRIGDGSYLQGIATGMLHLNNKIPLFNVFLVPKLATNLILVGATP